MGTEPAEEAATLMFDIEPAAGVSWKAVVVPTGAAVAVLLDIEPAAGVT